MLETIAPDVHATRVVGLEVSQAHDVGLAQIICRELSPDFKTAWGQDAYRVLYHFEACESDERLMLPRASAPSLAMGKALIEFFGGKLVYDHGRSHKNSSNFETRSAGSNLRNAPEDGAPWNAMQQRILHLKPLTLAMIEAYEEKAAYKRADLVG